MKLYADIHNNIVVVYENGMTASLKEAFLDAFYQDPRTMNGLEVACGFAHPRLATVMYDGKPNPGVESYLIALLEMGYDIELKKRS